jgi:hypothetical protein
MIARLEKITNYMIGSLAIIILIGAVTILVSNRDKTLSSSKPSTAVTNQGSTSDQSVALLGAKTSQNTPNLAANLSSISPTGNGSSRVELSINLQNTTNKRIEFSPPVEIFALDSSGKSYKLESNPLTTLLGGPLEVGESTNGTIFIVIDGSISKNDFKLYYQPNSSPSTFEISL